MGSTVGIIYLLLTKMVQSSTHDNNTSVRNTQIVKNEIYISGAQDGNISQITLNQQKIINNIS